VVGNAALHGGIFTGKKSNFEHNPSEKKKMKREKTTLV
jgi:hypothetical protein